MLLCYWQSKQEHRPLGPIIAVCTRYTTSPFRRKIPPSGTGNYLKIEYDNLTVSCTVVPGTWQCWVHSSSDTLHGISFAQQNRLRRFENTQTALTNSTGPAGVQRADTSKVLEDLW